MAHSLTFKTPHKSIIGLEPIELPDFVVLTGVNGSGKTHLLTAITRGNVSSSLILNPNNDVRLFDSSNIVPSDTGIFDPSQNQSQRSQWFNHIEQAREQKFAELQKNLMVLGVPPIHCNSIGSIKSLTVDKLRSILPNPETAVDVFNGVTTQIKQFGQQVGQHAYNHIGDEHWRKVLPKLQQNSPEAFVFSSQSAFFQNENFLWGEVDPFKQAFGRVFTTYRELIHDNDRLEKYAPKDDPNRKHLSADEFIETFGVPPWDFVNQILEECNLDFRVDHPPLYETTSYEPKLRKISSDVEMRFADLSSGEKVLMSFALCLYNSQERRQAKVFPKLLLLDEVDAPLHPSMTVSLLNTIQNVLVKDKNVAVIMTTHSPSTVALAPEESIYAMNPDGPRVEKVSKSNALSILTTGVPTLSVSFDGRRQIFVESRTDAYLYDSLYQKYKSHLASERSLVFVEVGNKTESSTLEQNAGCDQVIRLVDSLNQGGNQSVLGLIDWDGKRQHEKRIHVLSPNIRDGLESLIFDPVLLLTTLIRENSSFLIEKKIINTTDTYISIANWSESKWQAIINALQNFILATTETSSDTIDIEYLNSMRLKIRKGYVHMDDHALENKILDCFGFLKPKNRHAGDLMKYIINTVLADFPLLLPTDLLVTFGNLLKDNFD